MAAAAAAAAVAVDGGIVLVVVGCRPVMSCVCVVHRPSCVVIVRCWTDVVALRLRDVRWY